MKKYKIFLIVIFIVMLIPIIIKTFQKKHSVEYKIDNYNINENFYIDNKKHTYEFKISNNKETYSYVLNENLNKRKKVIEEIKEFKKDNIKCIIPIYKKEIDNNIYCLKDNKQVSNYILNEDDSFKEIVKEIEEYDVKLPSSSNKSTKYKKAKVYQDNIIKGNAFILWIYKGIYVIENDKITHKDFIDYDLYDNVMSTVTSKYYVLFENSNVMGIENIHYYDIKKKKYKVFKLKDKISKDSYINGVHDDLIYVTDNKKKIQYAINLSKEEIEEVGKEELGYIKYDGNEKQILNKSDFFMKEQYFNNERIEEKSIDSKDIIKENNIYYYSKDDNYYKRLNDYNEVLLFELDDVKDWYVYDKDILLIVDDSIYLYNDDTGLRKILEYNEIKYNYENIIKFWK